MEGAMLTYNMELGIQLFHKAAQQLESLLQHSATMKDYGMALALVFLAWEVALLQEEHSREEYQRYLAGCLHICYEVRAFHGDAFVRCLYLLASLPHCIKDKESIQHRLAEMESYPYHPLTKNVVPISEYNTLTTTTTPMSYNQLHHRMPLSARVLDHIISGPYLGLLTTHSQTTPHNHTDIHHRPHTYTQIHTTPPHNPIYFLSIAHVYFIFSDVPLEFSCCSDQCSSRRNHSRNVARDSSHVATSGGIGCSSTERTIRTSRHLAQDGHQRHNVRFLLPILSLSLSIQLHPSNHC